MSNCLFVGRTQELQSLEALYKKKKPSLVVLKGRRRIGKSRLIQECAKIIKPKTFWSFAGLAPEDGISAQDQRDHFSRQLALTLKLKHTIFDDWTDAFEHLNIYLNPGDIILFDEISWMGSKDPSFIPKLKAWWDRQTSHLFLIFCGSISTWIQENILKSTAFFGRINLTITLEPLSIAESFTFLKALGMKLSAYDTYKLLSIAGGVPWYLEQFNPTVTADDTIKQLAFQKNGLLVHEFDRIFHDLFNGKGTLYKKILYTLQDGSKTLSEIKQTTDFAHSSTLSKMLDHLIIAGFVSKQSLWSFKTAQPLKQSLYRIADPYMRFYIKVIEPHMHAIEDGNFDQVPLSTMPGFEAHLGLQLEVLLLQNRKLLIQKLGISPIDIVRSGPYRQTKTAAQQGCQIDYLVQSKTNSLYICEFKFKRREIGSEIINEMQEKIKRLKAPKGFAKIAVLFHISGISTPVATSPYFYRIIDIIDFLENNNT